MFGSVDSDKNGVLSRDEFRHFCTMLFSDDSKPHAVSLVKVSSEMVIKLLVLPAACQVVSHYTAVIPLINRVPTAFLAPAITVRTSTVYLCLCTFGRAFCLRVIFEFNSCGVWQTNFAAGWGVCREKCSKATAIPVPRCMFHY